MCDFSHYSRPTDEWLAIEANLPPRPTATGDAVYALQAATNKEREEASAAAMKAEFAAGHSVMTIRDHTIPTRDGQTIEARSYRPSTATTATAALLPVYLHFHGGGFVYGSIAGEDATCARIAVHAGVVVLHVNYRHTPDHVYPAAFDDAEDGLAWLHAHADDLGVDPHKVVVGGISAGAQLTASLVLRKNLGRLGNAAAQACPPVAGQLLMIPCMAHHDCQEKMLDQIKDPSVWSHKQNENAPLLPMAVVKMFIGLLKVDHPDPNDLKLNPGNASPDHIKGLPPTTFGVAGLDPLRDEGLLYAKLLSENG